jgi:ribonuclease PH
MTYNERYSGRGFDEFRPIEARAGVIPNADGSAFFKIGNTTAYAAVYGPRSFIRSFCRIRQKAYSGATTT